jgi:hypothetical protein
MRVWFLVEWKLEDDPTRRAGSLFTCGKMELDDDESPCNVSGRSTCAEDEHCGVVAALSASVAKNPDEDGSDVDVSGFLALPGPVKRGVGFTSGVGAAGCLLESDGLAAASSTTIANDFEEDESGIHGPLPLAFAGLLMGKGGISGGIGASGRVSCTLIEGRLLGAH